uniref:Uncharacterized protein n=1 Tax=Solanum tuberosum TaxID=4113 RepID=M1D927_SOLTU
MWDMTPDSKICSHGLCRLGLIPIMNMNVIYVLWLLKKLYEMWVEDMNTRKANTRRMKGNNVNEEAPQENQAPQANQALINPPAMSDAEVRQVDQLFSVWDMTLDSMICSYDLCRLGLIPIMNKNVLVLKVIFYWFKLGSTILLTCGHLQAAIDKPQLGDY